MSALSTFLNGVNRLGSIKGAGKIAPKLSNSEFCFSNTSKSEHFTAGFGKAPMVPSDIEKRKYYIAGYRANNPARGVIDPQYASAVWLDDNSGSGGVLFISLDVVGLLNKDVSELKRRLSEFKLKTGCRKITVFATHNHAGIDTMGLWGPLPLSGKDKKFMELLYTSCVCAAFEAYNTRKKGRVFYGSAEVPDLQEDIRLPEVYSKKLTRLRFVPEDAGNEIWIVNFASHSESLQGCNSLVSADFPCYFREYIREKTGAETLYGVGAIGGMISMKIEDENILRDEHRLLESTRKIGYALARYALTIKDEKELEPRISYITQEFYVPVENTLLTIAAAAGIISVDRYFLPAPAVKTELSYFEIGSLPLLFLPCELFPELAYGGYLKAEESATGKGSEMNPPPLIDICGNNELIIFGLSNDEIGYVIPPNDYWLNEKKPYLDKGIDRLGRRHYEETNSAGPDAAKAIADALIKAMKNVNETKRRYL